MNKIKSCFFMFCMVFALSVCGFQNAYSGSCGGGGGQTTCPVTGEAVNKDHYVDQNGKRIYTSSEQASNEVKNNFDKYAETLEKQGVELEKTGQ